MSGHVPRYRRHAVFTGYSEDSFFGLVGDDRSIALLLILPMFPPFVGGWAGGGGRDGVSAAKENRYQCLNKKGI